MGVVALGHSDAVAVVGLLVVEDVADGLVQLREELVVDCAEEDVLLAIERALDHPGAGQLGVASVAGGQGVCVHDLKVLVREGVVVLRAHTAGTRSVHGCTIIVEDVVDLNIVVHVRIWLSEEGHVGAL